MIRTRGPNAAFSGTARTGAGMSTGGSGWGAETPIPPGLVVGDTEICGRGECPSVVTTLKFRRKP